MLRGIWGDDDRYRDVYWSKVPGKYLAGDNARLDNDGYYWFLHPLFARLDAETGKYVDLYGDAFFGQNDLPRLKALVAEAGELVRKQPESWRVKIGTQVHPEHKPLFRDVTRAQFEDLLGRLRALIVAAEQASGYIECVGD